MSGFTIPQSQGRPGVTVHSALTGLSANDHPQYRLIDDYEGGITAAGANQSTAYQLTKRVSAVTGGNGAGVKLPAAATQGDMWLVLNLTAGSPGAGLGNAINVYPASGETILPLAANARNYQSGNTAVMYQCLGSGTWRALTWDMKSDHVSRTIGDTLYFYGAVTGFNGIAASGGTFDSSVVSTFSGATVISAALTCNGTISPTALGAGPTADYSPTGLSTCNNIRQDMSAAGAVSGLAAQGSGRRIRLFNISSFPIYFFGWPYNKQASSCCRHRSIN